MNHDFDKDLLNTNKKLYNKGQSASPIYKNKAGSGLLCFKREWEQSHSNFLWRLSFFFSSLHWSEKGCWDITCGRVIKPHYSKQYTTIRTSCYLLHDGSHMGTDKQKSQNSNFLTFSGWTHIYLYFSSINSHKTLLPDSEVTEIPCRKCE